MPSNRKRSSLALSPQIEAQAGLLFPAGWRAVLAKLVLSSIVFGSVVLSHRVAGQDPAADGGSAAPSSRTMAAIARDVFLVVDVSGSIPFTRNASQRPAIKDMIADGKRLALRLVDGSFSAEDFPDWTWNEEFLIPPLKELVSDTSVTHSLSGPGKRAVILPFADKAVDHPSPVSPPFAEFPGDFEVFVEANYPAVFRDQHTYLELARARTAKLAESLQIRQYYILMVTDELASPQQEAKYAADEETLLQRWDSENFVASKTRIGLFKYVGSGLEAKNFALDVWRVDLDLAPAPARILTVSPPPDETLPPGPLEVNWTVATGSPGARSQPQGYTYFLSLLDSETGAMLQSLSVRDQYTATLPVERPGSYRLLLSGTRHESSADTQFPDVLGQGEVLLTVADAPSPPSVAGALPADAGGELSRIVNVKLVLELEPLFAGRQSTIAWRSEAPAAAPLVTGEFQVAIAREDTGAEMFNRRTRDFSINFVFPTQGEYRLRIDFHPDGGAVVPALVNQVIKVEEESPPPPPPVPIEEDLSLRFVLPIHNSTNKSKKLVFKWIAPETDPKIGQYRLRVSGPESFTQVVPITTYAKTFRKSGKYVAHVSVLAPNELSSAVRPAQATFTIEGGGASPWLILLVLLLGGVGYFLWKKHQAKSKNTKTSAN